MSPLHIAAILRDVYTWQQCQGHSVRVAFERRMANSAMLPSDVKMAWLWFLSGYAEGMAHV